MSARRIDGKALASRIESELRGSVEELRKKRPGTPRFDAILVGEDPASKTYLGRKTEAAARVGIASPTHRLASVTSQKELESLIDRLNGDAKVHGILLQLPLPEPLDAAALHERIDPGKDIDCFHPTNLGRALLGRAAMPPPTPQAVVELLESEKVRLKGADVAIVSHSNLVGKPLAALLMNRDATVTVCHKFTKDLAARTRIADVLVSGTGVAGLITKAHVKPGAVVIDVGFGRDADGKAAGDVRPEVEEVASAITPVPGGVGPVTVAVLLRNVVAAFRQQTGPAA